MTTAGNPARIDAGSHAGRVLLALRAGPLAEDEVSARWGIHSMAWQALTSLARAGEWVVKVGDEYRITQAGRAACPFRNPLAAPGALPEHKENMSMTNRNNKTTRHDLLAAIEDAGPDGTTVAALTVALGVSDQTIFNHLKTLTSNPGATVFRPRRGLLVATRFSGVATEAVPEAAPAAAVPAEVDEAEVEKIAREYAEMIDFDLEEAQSIDVTASAPLGAHYTDASTIAKLIDAQPKLGSEAPAVRPSPFSEDIELDDPEQVEFAIFSSGGLDMYTDHGNVTLGREVLRKLRAFLGLFAEAA